MNNNYGRGRLNVLAEIDNWLAKKIVKIQKTKSVSREGDIAKGGMIRGYNDLRNVLKTKFSKTLNPENQSYDALVTSLLSKIRNCKTVDELKKIEGVSRHTMYSSVEYDEKLKQLTNE